jgi:hypothetical protein
MKLHRNTDCPEMEINDDDGWWWLGLGNNRFIGKLIV